MAVNPTFRTARRKFAGCAPFSTNAAPRQHSRWMAASPQTPSSKPGRLVRTLLWRALPCSGHRIRVMPSATSSAVVRCGYSEMSRQWIIVGIVVGGLAAGAAALARYGPDVEQVQVGSHAPDFKA